MKYRITADVTKAVGFQTWVVEAASEQEAYEKFMLGDAEFEEEDIEVYDLNCEQDSLVIEPVEE